MMVQILMVIIIRLNLLLVYLSISCLCGAGITRELQNMAASTKGGDSEGELQDQTPDTDDSGAHSYPEVSSSGQFISSATSSFKRAPIMGNRGLEQRGKKARTYPPKEAAGQQKVCTLTLVW